MKKNEFAFPKAGNEWSEMEWVPAPAQAGMTLRDYFAAKALIAWYCKLEDGVSNHPDSVAIWCYQLADAMLKAREQ